MNNKHLTPMWIVYVDGQRLDIAYFFLDHKINLKEHENCNTALFGTLVPKKSNLKAEII